MSSAQLLSLGSFAGTCGVEDDTMYSVTDLDANVILYTPDVDSGQWPAHDTITLAIQSTHKASLSLDVRVSPASAALLPPLSCVACSG